MEKQVQQVKQEQLNPEQQISLLVANVLTPNHQYHLLLKHIDDLQPDLVLTLESDQLARCITAYRKRISLSCCSAFG
jgi:endonuclease/exonuclease/phosphatase (EEP) superfamily protein YafD